MTVPRVRRDLRAAVRYLPLAVVPLLLCASTFPGRFRVPWEYWLLAMAAAVLYAAGERWPVPRSLALSVLAVPMFRMQVWGLSGLVPYLGAVALVAALARTRRGAPVVAACVGWAVAELVGRWDSHDAAWPRVATVVEVGAYVGLPVLLGLYLRSQRELAAGLRLRAAEAEARRADAESSTRTLERAAMARELHDLVAHHMASIVLRIGVARHVVDTDPKVERVLDDVHDTAADALADIRRLLAALRDPALGEVALIEPAAMRSEIEGAVRRVRSAGFTVTAEIAPDLGGLDAIGRLTLMRLVQESLTNVMRHADAAMPVDMVVRRSDGGVTMRVESGGGTPGRPGHGLIGMRERVELAGGRITAGAAAGGWAVDAWLPVDPRDGARQRVEPAGGRFAVEPTVGGRLSGGSVGSGWGRVASAGGGTAVGPAARGRPVGIRQAEVAGDVGAAESFGTRAGQDASAPVTCEGPVAPEANSGGGDRASGRAGR